MTEEERVKNTILFSKHRLLHQLRAGRIGTVWLTAHIGLEEYRATRCVPKRDTDYDSFRGEALVLKKLHHPGIPTIYDLEEDSGFFYLIEEYLEGHPLYALTANQGLIQEVKVVCYGVRVCGLVAYMRSACEIPILHSNLQPNNLIICNGTVKLIGFDHTTDCRWTNIAPKRFGTVDCAASEQYTSDRMLDRGTNVYVIGAASRSMTAGTPREDARQSVALPGGFERVIRKYMDSDTEK